MSFSLPASRGFTLIEIMIVIAMILIILGTSVFPYAYYMERARVEKATDTLAGQWIMAHQDVRGGRLHDGSTSHAHIEIAMNVGDNFVTYSTYTGETSARKVYKKQDFDKNIIILGFSGSIDPTTTTLMYHISPPFATGAFSTGAVEFYMSGVTMTLGYPGATKESKRARDILLRPYFD